MNLFKPWCQSELPLECQTVIEHLKDELPRGWLLVDSDGPKPASKNSCLAPGALYALNPDRPVPEELLPWHTIKPGQRVRLVGTKEDWGPPGRNVAITVHEKVPTGSLGVSTGNAAFVAFDIIPGKLIGVSKQFLVPVGGAEPQVPGEVKAEEPEYRRFRTLKNNAIGMVEIPAGTVFRTIGPIWKCEFDDPELHGCCYGCSPHPNTYVDTGEIEEIFDSPKQQQQQQQQPKKETTEMSPIVAIEKNVTLVNGLQPKAYRSEQRSDMLGKLEAEIKRLDALEFKTRETRDEIAALR